MSSDKSQSELPSAPAVRSSPAASARRHMPRRSTISPLDAADPLAPSSPPKSPPKQPPLIPERKPLPSAPRADSRSPAPPITVVERAKKDFSFLLRRDNFHALNDNSIPLAFRDSPFYPTHKTSIPQLLSNGRFRAVAALSAQKLISEVDKSDHEAIFSLFFTRLACLQLAGLHDIAGQESKALQDLNDPLYLDQASGKHLVPWELRVLAVRLQAMGFGDWRRGVMGYYELAREARIEFRRGESKARDMWQERLGDLGIRVGNALLEIGDNDGAIRHLKTLQDADNAVSKTRIGLVLLRAGDVAAARECIEGPAADDLQHPASGRVLEALCKMADGSFNEAAVDWQELASSADVNSEIIQLAKQNLAVCFVFTGEIQQALDLLENEVDEKSINHVMTFNLATIYELCSDRSNDHKVKLSSKIAALEPTSTGWDYTNADFKL